MEHYTLHTFGNDRCAKNEPVLSAADRELLNELDAVLKDITREIEEFHFYLAAEKLYHYVWHRLADEILEESKIILNGSDETAKTSRQWVLLEILAVNLKLLHPFMPFVTEELWSTLPAHKKTARC